jgi:hypothetical protein
MDVCCMKGALTHVSVRLPLRDPIAIAYPRIYPYTPMKNTIVEKEENNKGNKVASGVRYY